jgi:hypothetical protein
LSVIHQLAFCKLYSGMGNGITAMHEDSAFLQDAGVASSISSNLHNLVRAIGSAVLAKVTTKRERFPGGRAAESHHCLRQGCEAPDGGDGFLVMRNRGNLGSHQGSPSC